MYDGLGQACKEMKDVAAQIGGANGELLMDEASAKVSAAAVLLCCADRVLHRCYCAAPSHSSTIGSAALPRSALGLFNM